MVRCRSGSVRSGLVDGARQRRVEIGGKLGDRETGEERRAREEDLDRGDERDPPVAKKYA